MTGSDSTVRYQRTPHGLLQVLYHTLHSVDKKAGIPPVFSMAEYRAAYLHSPRFEALHAAWVSSGFAKSLRPSTVREDRDKPLTLDNVRMSTWSDNSGGRFIVSDTECICRKCRTAKPLEDFPKADNRPSRFLGVSSWCRACTNEASKGASMGFEVKARRTWKHLMSRCYNPKDIGYENYGGRGISACAQWHDRDTFLAWYRDTYISGLTLDRRDNEEGYSPENCRWVTLEIQNKNKRVTDKQLTHIKTMHATVRDRIAAGGRKKL